MSKIFMDSTIVMCPGGYQIHIFARENIDGAPPKLQGKNLKDPPKLQGKNLGPHP